MLTLNILIKIMYLQQHHTGDVDMSEMCTVRTGSHDHIIKSKLVCKIFMSSYMLLHFK